MGTPQMIIALLLQSASLASPTLTLAEARGMSPSALADRLLPEHEHGPVVDAIINGRGLTPPSESVNRVWLVERMVPFDATVCRSHVFNIEMRPSDAALNPWTNALPTHPVNIEQYDRLWVPPAGAASVPACASAPARASGFSEGGLGLRQAANLVEQARSAFVLATRRRNIPVSCRGERGACRKGARRTLAEIDLSSLGLVEKHSPKGEPYYVGDKEPADAAWGPSHVQFTFPYAAEGATWVITVDRSPAITAVLMEARSIVYH